MWLSERAHLHLDMCVDVGADMCVMWTVMWLHLDRVIDDEGRLLKPVLAKLFKASVEHLWLGHVLRHVLRHAFGHAFGHAFKQVFRFV